MIAFWFLHAWLALAAAPIAAAAITVHLLNRARQTPMRWAAMQFLQAATNQSRRRLHLERWLLIVLRTAMLALLALFVARPIARNLGMTAAAETDTALLVVMDNGLAMQAPSAQPAQPLLTDAVDAVLPLVHTWKGPVAVLPTLGQHKPQWFERSEMAESMISRVPATAGRADWANLLSRIRDTLAESPLPSHRRTVLIVTSLTQGNWPRPDLLRQPISQLKDVAGRLLLVDLQPTARNNITVTDLSVESAFAGRDLPVRAAASITNRSAVPVSNLKLIWSVDGREVRQDDLPEIPAGLQRSLTADLPVLASGQHNVSVRLADASDALKADDQRWSSVPVPLRRRIVLIEPDPSAPPGSRTSLFVAAVLSSAAEQSAVPLQVDVTAPSALSAALTEPADAVLLCDAGTLTAGDWQILKRQVERGGGLVTWLGPRSSPLGIMSAPRSESGLQSAPLSSSTSPRRQPGLPSGATPALSAGVPDATASEILPAVSTGVQTAPPRIDWSVRLTTPVRPAFLDLADGTATGSDPLGSIQTLVRVDPKPGTQVLAQTATGLPVVLLRQLGQGRSILVTTSPDLSWSNLAGRPTFPAFVLGLLREVAARRTDGTQVDCGQPIRLVMPGGSAQQGRWIKPDGSSEPARISLDGGAAAAVLPVAAVPGAYQLEADGPGRTAFANADTAAGDLREIGETARKDLADSSAILVARKDLSSTLATVGVDEWTAPLAYMVMALALLEIVLTAAFTRARQL